MFHSLGINTPSNYKSEKLFNINKKNTFTTFNYKLFKLNEIFREKSAKIGFKNNLTEKKTGNKYLDNMMIIENYPKENRRKINRRLILSLRKNKEGSKNNIYQSEHNLALVPLRDKINKKYYSSLFLNKVNNIYNK